MIRSEEERLANKKQQLARLAAKGTPEYPVLYAKQPEQIRLAAENKVKREAEREATDALKRAVIAAGEEAANLWKTNELTTLGAEQ